MKHWDRHGKKFADQKKTIGEHEQLNLLNTDNPNFDNELVK